MPKKLIESSIRLRNLTNKTHLRTIQEFLGHKNIAETQIYAHVTLKQLRDIHRKFHGGRNLL